MRRCFPFLASLALATGLYGAPSYAQKTITLNTANWVPPNHHLVKNVMEPWAKQLEEATNGRIKVNTYSTPPVDAPNFFTGIRNGVLDVGFSAHAYTPGRFVLPGMAELPFLGDSAEAQSVAYQRTFEKHLAQVEEHPGLVVLAVFTHGPGHFFNTQKKIDEIEDLVGMKWRVGGGAANEAAKALRTTAFLKPPGETYELMSSGIADGVFFPADTMVTYRLDGLVKYATLVPGGFYNTSFAFVMNRKSFERLSEEDQAIIKKISGENFARMAGQSWDEGDIRGLEALKKTGADISVASEELVEDMKEKLSVLEAKWVEEANKKGLDGEKVLASFRAELEEIRKQESNN